jgi:hypothetical protein
MLCEHGYVEGYPDKSPITISLESASGDSSDIFQIAVSKFMLKNILKAWLNSQHNFNLKNTELYLKTRYDKFCKATEQSLLENKIVDGTVIMFKLIENDEVIIPEQKQMIESSAFFRQEQREKTSESAHAKVAPDPNSFCIRPQKGGQQY